MTRVRPILFSGPMVKAILAGKKSQTRRIAQSMYDKAFMEGDVLWVRETWSHTGTGVWKVSDTYLAGDGEVIYAADGGHEGAGWFPSIHMPKRYSRLTLTEVGVRIEPLRNITEADARAEGVASVAEYVELWDKLNGARMAWWMNPLVFVISFKPAQLNIDRYLERQTAA